jgi:hypothetical protein
MYHVMQILLVFWTGWEWEEEFPTRGRMSRCKCKELNARFSHFKRVYYNLEGVTAPDPLQVAKLRRRKYSFKR